MVKVSFYDPYGDIDENRMLYAVIMARYDGRWVFCKHKERTTYECPGGHREPGEPVDTTARRELYEETGATDFDIKRICVYSVRDVLDDGNLGTESYGMLYVAEITEFGPLPEEFEMEKIVLFDTLPEQWTYPEVQPQLLARAMEAL